MACRTPEPPATMSVSIAGDSRMSRAPIAMPDELATAPADLASVVSA
jgi:hypothetical protein